MADNTTAADEGLSSNRELALAQTERVEQIETTSLEEMLAEVMPDTVDTDSDHEEVIVDDSGNMHVRAPRRKVLSTQQAAEERRPSAGVLKWRHMYCVGVRGIRNCIKGPNGHPARLRFKGQSCISCDPAKFQTRALQCISMRKRQTRNDSVLFEEHRNRLQRRISLAKPTPEISLRKDPNTTLLTCSRKGAQLLNDLVLEGKFPRYPPLAIIPENVESDPANYDDDHHLKESCELEPSELKLYKRMQVNMTKNNKKDMDFVNGMRGEVLGWHGVSKSVRVKTRVGHIVDVWPWSDPDLDDLTYYPLRPGYTSTLLKFHGD